MRGLGRGLIVRLTSGGISGLIGALVLAPGAAGAQSLPRPDTVFVRIETGASAGYSNELYYEDVYTDTTFLGRRIVGTPEPRYAGELLGVLQGTYRNQRGSYQVVNDLSLGDKVQREALAVHWRDEFAPDWRLAVDPAGEWRHDRSYDRDQEEWRGSVSARLRRSFHDRADGVELGGLADLVRSSGVGSEFLPDRNQVRGSLALDHLGLLGDEWRLGYSLAFRTYPDSVTRDHVEHGWEGRWRRPFGGGHVVTFETFGRRRQTRQIVTTSRDNFWEEDLAIDMELRTSDRWVLQPRLEAEALQYDVQEPDVFFDYQVLRAQLGVRYESGGRWALTVGPRGEVLAAPLDPDEAYREVAGAVQFEGLGRSSMWEATPVVGWRDYHQSGDGVAAGFHSSFTYYGLDAYIDQPLMNRLRWRALASLRWESHTDPSQDAASFQLSTQVRWGVR